jgi:hypothetical protein
MIVELVNLAHILEREILADELSCQHTPSITRFDTLIWHIFGRIPNLVQVC